MYNTILLAAALQRWDRYSAHALAARELALFIASNASKRLHVLSVYEYGFAPSPEVSPVMAAQILAEGRERTAKLMEQKLAAFVAPLKAEGLEVSGTLRLGSPREVIVQVARDIQADLLVIGSHSKRSILDVALGGTAQHVSRRAPCQVVLVSPKP
jgi:nucleotide-binding universal stress UspA family protein